MKPQVMGIVNVTPDSFSDGGLYATPSTAIAHGTAMLDAGASIVDVGGESTRPGARPVPASVERARVVPVIAALVPIAAAVGARVSVDTRHDEVARAAVDAGATIINDVSSTLGPTAASLGVGWIAMHMQGDPTTMQDAPEYGDVVGEVLAMLVAAADDAVEAGVSEVWIDPGIGFGKTFEQNWAILARLDAFTSSAHRVCIGASRKGFLGQVAAASDASVAASHRDHRGSDAAPSAPTAVLDRLEGSLGTAVWASMMGVDIVRVHDVRATVQALTLVGDADHDSIVLPTPEVA